MDNLGRVLIIDDDRDSLARFATVLGKAGFGVQTAGRSREALRALERGAAPFDVVLADLAMPPVDGVELVGAIRALRPDLPFVLTADSVTNATTLHAAELEALCLTKPIAADTLTRTIALAMKRWAGRGARPSPALAVRTREDGPAPTFTATEAKNQFARILDTAMARGAVVITKHDQPRAVLLSMEEFAALSPPAQRKLNLLSERFDALLARMQAPEARDGVARAFHSSSSELGKAARAAAKKRG